MVGKTALLAQFRESDSRLTPIQTSDQKLLTLIWDF